MNKQRIENIPELLVDRTMYFSSLEIVMLENLLHYFGLFGGEPILEEHAHGLITYDHLFNYIHVTNFCQIPPEQWDTRLMYLFSQ